MNLSGLTLLIPEKSDDERDAVANAWIASGGKVLRLGRFWEPPAIEPAKARVYGNDAFCLVLQQKLGLELCSPGDELIFSVPPEFLQRKLFRRTLGELAAIDFPVFVKPVIPKLFRARVYQNEAELLSECVGLPRETAVMLSEIAVFVAEARCFVFNGTVLDVSIYEGAAEIGRARAMAERLVTRIDAPSALVVDIGLTKSHDWVVVEFNAAWGAGLNGCNADRVLPCVEAASRTQTRPVG